MKLDVLIPFKNGEHTAKECLDSLIPQRQFIENLILVNDSSSDRTVDVINSYRPKFDNLILIDSPRSGISHALNHGLGYCKAEITARLDIDDFSAPNRFCNQIDYLKSHPNVAAVGSSIKILTNDFVNYKSNKLHFPPRITLEKLTKLGVGNFFITAHPAVSFRRSVIAKLGCYRETDYSEDLDLWIRILRENFEIHNLDEVLTTYTFLNRLNNFDLSTARRRAWVTSLLICCARLNKDFRMEYLNLQISQDIDQLDVCTRNLIEYSRAAYIILIRWWKLEIKTKEYQDIKIIFSDKSFDILKALLSNSEYKNVQNTEYFLDSSRNLIKKIFFN